MSNKSYTIDGIKKELDDLEHGDIKLTLYNNYIPIHIVTIIEQFCRVMIKLGRINHKGRYGRISISTLVSVFEAFGEYKLKGDPNYDENIRKFCTTTNKCNYQLKNNNVRFKNKAEIDELVKYILDNENNNVSTWLELYCYSFQNIGVIEEYVGTLFDDKYTATKYMMMFDTRHNLVHTLNELNFDKEKHFKMVRDLFKTIEDNK